MTGSVVIAGGGTAGHVFPGLALGRTLRDRGFEVRFVGTERGLESRLVPAAGFAFGAVMDNPDLLALATRAAERIIDKLDIGRG